MKIVLRVGRIDKLNLTAPPAGLQLVVVKLSSAPQHILLRHHHKHPLAPQSGQTRRRIRHRVHSRVIQPARSRAKKPPHPFHVGPKPDISILRTHGLFSPEIGVHQSHPFDHLQPLLPRPHRHLMRDVSPRAIPRYINPAKIPAFGKPRVGPRNHPL
ncbi:hypothetical protein IEQ34_008730 [Dendrobium chrysotoxum]|uniref:Uncharacterized protein n=1 Tax=Dendrobium chrysotoxum TaxID=161865 RepID=A0AAV7GYI8_DENCH|nr:hypothetical protein IEQ34_008730 [Dendrobium chrysotoxum]